ncbi:MAG: GNAT family N-acetyltransferase [Sphingomicrobium sp.]
MIELLVNQTALERVSLEAIRALTEAATATNLSADRPNADRAADNRRVVEMSAATCAAAADDPRRHLVVAVVGHALAGYMIATIHGEDDRELDWLMVDPQFHGRAIAGPLTEAGIDWLGRDRAQWLNVINDNARAIAFYRKHGFKIDPAMRSGHAVPRVIMRRAAGAVRP